jgi:O-acetyl-ADP-ribose deacetylase (regulator of RNase III)
MIRPGAENLLEARADALVNPVNCEGVMGKGLALQFKHAWPAMYAVYRADAKAGRVVPGTIHVWPTGSESAPRFILNFPTKRRWRSPSRLEDIDAGLVDLVAKIEELGIRSIAIPALGAGHGGLDWQEVRPRIVAALAPLESVDVQLWEPTEAPPR